MTLLEEKHREKKRIRKAEEYFQISQEYLDTAGRIQKLFSDHRMAVYTGFHALNLCLRSLILLKGKRIPRSNIGIISSVGNLYAKSKEVSKELLKGFHWALIRGDEATSSLRAEIKREDAQKMIRLGKQTQKVLDIKLKGIKGKE